MARATCGGRSLSVARNCPYSDNEENCRYGIFTWVSRLNKCSNCERFLKKRFPNIDTSSYNIDENGNVLREVEVSKNQQLTKAKELLTRFVMSSVYFNKT